MEFNTYQAAVRVIHQLKGLGINVLLILAVLSPLCVLGGVEIVFTNDDISYTKDEKQLWTSNKEKRHYGSCANTVWLMKDTEIQNGLIVTDKTDEKQKRRPINIILLEAQSGQTYGKNAKPKHIYVYWPNSTKIPTVGNAATMTIQCSEKGSEGITVTGKAQFINSDKIAIESLNNNFSANVNTSAQVINMNNATIEFSNSTNITTTTNSSQNNANVTISFGDGDYKDPEDSLVLDENAARIVNYGIISAENANADIDIHTFMYIGKDGIIKVKPERKIEVYQDGTNFVNGNYPIYAITRISENLIKQKLDPGPLGEKAAKAYYENFEKDVKEVTKSANSRNQGIDLMGYTDSGKIIIHEAKCDSTKTAYNFSLSSDKSKQMSWEWIFERITSNNTFKESCEFFQQHASNSLKKNLKEFSNTMDTAMKNKKHVEETLSQSRTLKNRMTKTDTVNLNFYQDPLFTTLLNALKSFQSITFDAPCDISPIVKKVKPEMERRGNSAYFIQGTAVYHLQRMLQCIKGEPVSVSATTNPSIIFNAITTPNGLIASSGNTNNAPNFDNARIENSNDKEAVIEKIKDKKEQVVEEAKK